MKLSFIVDSASDIPINSQTNDFPLIIVPLNIQFGEDHYLDGVTISGDEFYKRMAAEKELPKTSQPSPKSFLDAFENEVEKGHEVLYLALSGNLSGTVQSARVARDMMDEKAQQHVYIVDSGIASAGVQVLLHRAIKMANEGSNVQEIVEHIENTKYEITGYVLLETLENVRKGGRISAVQGAIAEFLNIKPLLSIHDGIVETVDKFRGNKKAILKVKEMIHEWKEKNPEKTLYLIHSYSSAKEVMEELGDALSLSSFKDIIYTRFGSTIGTHASKKAIGFVSY